jgi:hydroxymethylglutaryl-CoA lyase
MTTLHWVGLFALAVIAGAVVPFQSAINANLGRGLGHPLWATLASLAAFGDIVSFAGDFPVRLNASIATTFGCPFEGKIDEDRVLQIVEAYQALGIRGISLADTTGMANPRQVERLVKRVLERVSASDLTLHFHNTRGLGLCNVLAAYEAGARRFDAALGGLGGCPFAPGGVGQYLHRRPGEPV